MKIISAFKCDYCGKKYERINHISRHELMCTRNPENKRACYGCIHLCKKEAEIYSGVDDYFSSEPIYDKVDFLYCEKLSIFLYTPQNKVKGNFKHIDNMGDDFKNSPMPKTCNDYKSEIG